MKTPRPPKRQKKPDTLASIRKTVLQVSKEYDVQNIRIFGSFARGDARPKSDIDLLVDLPDSMTLLTFSALKIHLEKALKRKVDIVSTRSVKPALRNQILAEAKTL